MDDPPPPNPYKTLNVPKDATLATIRSAHRKLVLSCHPDKVQDESAKKIKAEQFHQVQQAYEILSDDKRRLRYDEKIKLDELRAEMANEKPPPLSRRATDFGYASSRGGPPPMADMRERPIYETREPRNTRYSDEDYPSTRYEARPSKHYDDYYPIPSPRRTSGRGAEEKKKPRDYEDERDIRKRDREREAMERDQRTKKRDKAKKMGTESKSKSKFSPYIDDGSDSELEDRRYSNKRDIPSRPRYEGVPAAARDEPRRSDQYDRGYDDELYSKISAREEHINKSREATVEIEPRRPGRSRAASTLESRPPPPPPVDSAKRPTMRRTHGSRQISPVRLSKKEKRSPEIVDPPPSTRKPSLPVGSSDPKGLKKGLFNTTPLRKEPQRSATYQPIQRDCEPPSMRRAETMPLNRSQRNEPLKSSNLKNMKAPSDSSETSDSDSEETEEIAPRVRPNPLPKTTSYRINREDEKYVVESQDYYKPRERETSPKLRRSSEYPNAAPRGSPANTRTPPMPRSASYAFPQEERSPRPGISRTDSARPTPTKSSRLWGTEKAQVEDAYMNRRSSNNYPEENSHYTKLYSRKGSEDLDRDAYPGSKFRQHRPHMGRTSTPAY